MKEYLENIDDIIGKYLAGEATREEHAFVDEWMEESAENRKTFQHYQRLFETAASEKASHEYDVDAAWATVKSKIQPGRSTVRLTYASYWRVAATILLVVSAGLMLYRWITAPRDVQAIETFAEAAEKVLPDGTETYLNKESEITYKYDPVRKERVATLKGEAFFEISRDVKKQFLVKAEELIIKDIGTSFNVKAYDDTNMVEVFVKEGSVAMYTESNSGLKLEAGETGVYNKLSKTFEKRIDNNENAIAYKTLAFTFAGDRLGDIVDRLNQVYDKKIRLENDKISDCPITVSFTNESIDVIAEIIAATLELQVTESGDEILLSGEGCEKD